MDSVLAKLESTLLGRNSRGDGKVADDDQKGKGESVIDKLETLDKTTSEVATAVTNASGEAATLGQATQNIVSQLADNLVGADNGVLSELLELNKNLAKIPELIELQTASNELAKTQVTQGEKAAAVSSSATFASCVLDGKQVGCTLGGGKLAIAGHSFAANFPELYECVLSSDSLKKDLASLKTSATSSNMVICNLPSFGDVQLPSKEVNLDLTLSEGGVAVNAKPLKVRFVTEAPKINFKESSIQVSALVRHPHTYKHAPAFPHFQMLPSLPHRPQAHVSFPACSVPIRVRIFPSAPHLLTILTARHARLGVTGEND